MILIQNNDLDDNDDDGGGGGDDDKDEEGRRRVRLPLIMTPFSFLVTPSIEQTEILCR